MSIHKESVHVIVCTLFCSNLIYRVMNMRTFAQEAVLQKINEKTMWATEFQDGLDNDNIVAYNESHGDYSEYC